MGDLISLALAKKKSRGFLTPRTSGISPKGRFADASW